MEMTTDHLFQIIGVKEAELIGLRMELAEARKRIKELEPEPEKKLEAVQ